jgi:hypothetical protein
MVPPVVARRGKVHPVAAFALVVGLLAWALALYGSFLSELHLAGSPLNVARNHPGLESTRESKRTRIVLQVAAYFLPFGLGLVAAFSGGEAMKAIERRPGSYSGNVPAVFAVMLGGLAAVLSGCMILSMYLW